MTRDRRLLLLLGLLMAYGLFVVECHQHKDATTEARHRHRHRHESSNRRSHHDLDRRSWQEVDYEYDGDAEKDSTDEDDYETPSHYDYLKSYQQQRSYHGWMFEPRYPGRYYGGGYHGSDWYDEDSDRRKTLSRHKAKNRRHPPNRNHHGRAYSRNHDTSDYDDDTREDFDYRRLHRYVKNRVADRLLHSEWRKNARRHSSPKKDWRSKMSGRLDAWRHYLKDRTVDRDKESRWNTEYWKTKSNSSEHKFHSFEDESKSAEDEDYKDHGGLEESDKDEEEEEDDIWKILDDKDEDDEDDDDEVEELDNDFYKSKSKSALTYDDIIRRLTSDDPTTARTTVKRDYRNIEDRHAKREGYRLHFKHEPRNVSRVLGPFTFANKPIINRPHAGIAVSSSVKSAVSDEPKSPKNALAVAAKRNDWQQERRTAVKIDGTTHSTRTKSKRGDLDNDGYLYGPDNEKEDDLVTDEEEDSDMQADVTDTGYADDDNEDEDSIDTTSRVTTTVPKTTTTAPKWPFHQHGKNTRANGRGSTAAEYNGHQPKNDYPPMSAHSVYKWRTLGTRESVKQTMNSMRQSNNDPAAIQEASLYWNKIKEEGSCKWPRAKLIRISNIHPDSAVSYFPHCAILHECSDNTGCCATDQLTCVASKSRSVELTIYAKSMEGTYRPVRLMFNNHTECECREKTPEMQRIDQSPSSPQNMKITPSIKLCKCTKYFVARRYPQGDCRCECPDKNDNCKPISKGKRILDYEDRECVRNSECTTPTCEFGTYRSWEYRCPAKKDTFDAAANHVMGSQRQIRRNERRNRTG
ncbi:midasin-like isoform X2 [Odontomachus brunneus]|uniref:midasin-like isoform X2 n=1 Tax=Odontomachus brunneus TaxID=486640 RepID=UPI0013F25D6F|nr:midasin-like isoform X2 [Odontomachus brunneus]